MANKGWSLAILDLQGTGDSEGDLSSVRLDAWINDVITSYQFLREQENCKVVRLMAMRLGALVALQQRVLETVRPDLVVLWEPIAEGRRAIRQFLRLRVAADRFRGLPTSVDGLLATAHEQGVLEVAGYQLSAEFIQDLLHSAVDIEAVATTIPVQVLSITKPVSQPAGSSSSAGSHVRGNQVSGVRFWDAIEITVAHEFIQQTVTHFPTLD